MPLQHLYQQFGYFKTSTMILIEISVVRIFPMKLIRRTFHLTAILISIMLIVQLNKLTNLKKLVHQKRTSKHDFIWLNFKNNTYLIDTRGCRISYNNPFDPSIINIFRPVKRPYECNGKQSMFIIKPNATIEVNKTVLQKEYRDVNLSLCIYRPLHRSYGNKFKILDDVVILGQAKILQLDKRLNEDHIMIFCYKDKTLLLDEVFSFVRIKDEVEKRCNNYDKLKNSLINHRLNIIYIGIDSVSKLNFLRHFPRTYKFLNEVLKPVELHGYTKVGDNTFPNIVPMLTGHKGEHYYSSKSRKRMYFDHLDFIWKHYAKRGYRTLFSEDAPLIGTFNYLKRGFKKSPTDYYTRPFSIGVEKSYTKKISDYNCINNKLEIEIYYDYLRQFVQTMDHRRFMTFTYIARLTHDKFNNAGYADFPTYELLKYLHQENALNHSVLLFFSDHGIRFGDIRKTFIGKIEERMPFMFLHFPLWFHESYPEISQNLRTNERRLTTPFDIHATIVHLLKLMEPVEKTLTSPHGLSLFNKIPNNRTCKDAFIAPHWCPCIQYHKAPFRSHIVIKAAKLMVSHINKLLSNLTKKCAVLRLAKILDVRNDERNASEIRNPYEMQYRVNQQSIFYLLTIEANPGKALFEGTVERQLPSNVLLLGGLISRINRYGKQALCLKDEELKKYCVCKTWLPK